MSTIINFPGPDILATVKVGREADWGNAKFRTFLVDCAEPNLVIETGSARMQLFTNAVQLNALSEMLTDTLAAMRGEAPDGDGLSDEYAAILQAFTAAKTWPNRADMLALITKLAWMSNDMKLEGAQAVTDHLDAAYEALGKCHAASADDGPLQADQRLDMAGRAR